MADPLIHPAIFADTPGVFAVFTTRHFADASRAQAEAAASRLGEDEGFYGTAFTEQVHGAQVSVVSSPGRVPGHDGLVTRHAGLLIGTVAADCALVLLADAEAGVVGTCHAGWRGAVGHILPKTVEAMQELGARPERLQVYIGPCIATEQFEVGEEVAAQFAEHFVHRRAEWERPHVDLRAALVSQLYEIGVESGHIEVSDACTVESEELFFSYRRENGTAGRMLGLIGLREE